MERTLRELAAQLPELDGLEALPDHLWDKARAVAANRPALPLSSVATGLSAIEAAFGPR